MIRQLHRAFLFFHPPTSFYALDTYPAPSDLPPNLISGLAVRPNNERGDSRLPWEGIQQVSALTDGCFRMNNKETSE